MSLGNPGCEGAAAAVVELRQAYFEVGIALYSEANEGQFMNVIIFVMLNNMKAIRYAPLTRMSECMKLVKLALCVLASWSKLAKEFQAMEN